MYCTVRTDGLSYDEKNPQKIESQVPDFEIEIGLLNK
jgi:hypothetical protein